MYELGRSLDNIPTYRLILKATWSIWCFQVRFCLIKIPRYFTNSLHSRGTYLSLSLSNIVIFGWKVSFLWAGQNVTKFFLIIFKVSIFAISWMIWNASFFKSKTNKVKQSLSSTTASLWIRTRKALVAFKINQQNKRSNAKRPSPTSIITLEYSESLSFDRRSKILHWTHLLKDVHPRVIQANELVVLWSVYDHIYTLTRLKTGCYLWGLFIIYSTCTYLTLMRK